MSLSRRPGFFHLAEAIVGWQVLPRKAKAFHRRKTGQDNGRYCYSNWHTEAAEEHGPTDSGWMCGLRQSSTRLVLLSGRCCARRFRTGYHHHLAPGAGLAVYGGRGCPMSLSHLWRISEADRRPRRESPDDCPRRGSRLDAWALCGSVSRSL